MMNKSVKINPKLLVLIFFLMLGLSFASVPLYDLFCRVTGFGGTTQFSKERPSIIMPEIVSMRFDTNVSGNLPISFKVLKNREEIKIGESSNIKFQINNESTEQLKVVSTFNVSPPSAGKYFNKLECFCFQKQSIKSLDKKKYNLSYYIDPEILNDPATKNIKDITLSYTLFEVDKFKK